MSFFNTLLSRNGLSAHDGRPLWRYFLTEQDFEDLRKTLSYAKPYFIDARDAALYYAEWWKRNYDGGSPNKENVFNSIGGNIQYYYNYNEFYKIAKKGGQLLGFKWIVKQNTLRFKTLLLHGGLPLTHISANQGRYLRFLLAVLEEQPETIEDFIFQPDIINLLPKSSQNDTIYENCFEIVRSILNKENVYDDLLESDSTLKSISGQLKSRANQLGVKKRESKPKNYWLMSKIGDQVSIRLTLGLAPIYTENALSNILGIEIQKSAYQFYLNDKLICVFKKLFSGNYKTEWFNQEAHEWDGDDNLTNAYVIVDGNKIEIHDFIQISPSLNEPTLWSYYSENEWRLIKGSGSADKSAAVLMPLNWNSDGDSQSITICHLDMRWMEFEGELEIATQNESRKYLSGVESFDWTIESKKPRWMIKSNMPVIRGGFKIYLYDAHNKLVPSSQYEVWIKPNKPGAYWEELSQVTNLPLGCISVKIEMNGITAFDQVYNIGKLTIDYTDTAIDKARITVNGFAGLTVKLEETPILDISVNNNLFTLQVNPSSSKIPTTVKGALGLGTQRKLHFHMESPFQGMALVDKDGNIIEESTKLSLRNLYGLRLLTTPGKESILTLSNKFSTDVKISKSIIPTFQPLITFRDEIVRLFYLADAMDHTNRVCLQIKEGGVQKKYEISGFSHNLEINSASVTVNMENSHNYLELFAIPMSDDNIDVTPIPLDKEENDYKLPTQEVCKQWIVISSKEDGNQLMPRYVSIDSDSEYIAPEMRIKAYGEKLLTSNFNAVIWRQLLSLFTICSKNGYDIPFSTFDQFRALAYNANVAAKAFLFISINQRDKDTFMQTDVPEMEKDLGICFHWISNNDWENALNEVFDFYKVKPEEMHHYISLISRYMQEFGFDMVFKTMMGNKLQVTQVNHMRITDLRAKLGPRVLDELPDFQPRITKEYNIPIKAHNQVRLLVKAPIAVAESIKNVPTQYPIWGIDPFLNTIRRNIQYSQYLSPEFYKDTILHVLNTN